MAEIEQQTLPIQQALDLAVQHHSAGRLSEAENICQQILQDDPSYHKPIAIKPHHAAAHFNLGNLLQKLGRPEDAVVSYHKAMMVNISMRLHGIYKNGATVGVDCRTDAEISGFAGRNAEYQCPCDTMKAITFTIGMNFQFGEQLPIDNA